MFWANTRPRPEESTDVGEMVPLIVRTFFIRRDADRAFGVAGGGGVWEGSAFGWLISSTEPATGDHPGPSVASTPPQPATKPAHNPTAASACPRTPLPAHAFPERGDRR